MSAPKYKSAHSNGSAKSHSVKVIPASNVPSSPGTNLRGTAATDSARPDKAAYEAEQDRIRSEIDGLHTKLALVRAKISSATNSSPANDKRVALKTELDSIRGQQSSNKSSRAKKLDQLKALQDGIQKKIQNLQAARSKTEYKTVADVNTNIKNLRKQVDSGSMKLVDEKRALHEIDQARRTRKIVEKFQADQESIEADRQDADELRKQLDDPESKEISERYDSIKAELDEIQREADESYACRSKLFEERESVQAQLNALFNEKRDSADRFRDANNRYWNKVNEDRARRAERARAQRAAEEAQRTLAITEHLREEASMPAFQTQIEDCQTLIDALSGKSSGSVMLSSSVPAKSDVSGVPQLEIRQVEGVEDAMVARKKKGDGEESYFVGRVKKGKKGPKTVVTRPADTDSIHLSIGPLSALLSLSIPPPAGQADVPRVIEDLKTKKAWFEANQTRQTAENVAKAEAEIQRLTNGAKTDGKRDMASHEESPPNGNAEHPPEYPSGNTTPQIDGSGDEVEEKVMEVVDETEKD